MCHDRFTQPQRANNASKANSYTFSAIKRTIRDSLSGAMFSPIRSSTGGDRKLQIMPNPLLNPNLADVAHKLAFTVSHSFFFSHGQRIIHLVLNQDFKSGIHEPQV